MSALQFPWAVDFFLGTEKNGFRNFGHPKNKQFELPLLRLLEEEKLDIFHETGLAM